jgi:hypothetical protein
VVTTWVRRLVCAIHTQFNGSSAVKSDFVIGVRLYSPSPPAMAEDPAQSLPPGWAWSPSAHLRSARQAGPGHTEIECVWKSVNADIPAPAVVTRGVRASGFVAPLGQSRVLHESHIAETDSVAGVRGLELANVGLKNSRPNSLAFQNIFVPETFRGKREGGMRLGSLK